MLRNAESHSLIQERQVRNLGHMIKTKRIIVDTIKSDADNFSSRDPEIKSFLGELSWVKALGYEIHYPFVFSMATMPRQLLTLILTLSMGALGSVIFLTLAYFRDQGEIAFSWYLFRPFLGMVTAFAVFVLAKAGQLTISSGSNVDVLSEDLSPYFISFLAIVSGLLSEQAIRRIRGVGDNIFPVSPPPRTPSPGGQAAGQPQTDTVPVAGSPTAAGPAGPLG